MTHLSSFSGCFRTLCIVFNVLFCAAASSAASPIFTPLQGDWNTGANWSTGNIPASGDTAYVIGFVTAIVSSSPPSIAAAFVGQGAGDGAVLMNAGSFTIGDLQIGKDTGRYGFWRQNSGTLALTTLELASNSSNLGEHGRLAVSGGTVAVAQTATIGMTALGDATVSSGAFSCQTLAIASQAGSGGSYFETSGGTTTINGSLLVGSASNAQGRAIFTGGTCTWNGTATVSSGSNLTIQGASPNVSWGGTTTVAALTISSGASLEFNPTNSGINDINLKTGKIAISSGSTLIIDGALYTLDDGTTHTYTLVTHGGYSNLTTFPAVQVVGFLNRTASVSYTANTITVSIGPGPGTQAQQDLYSDTWVGTDGLNRALPTAATNPLTGQGVVGIFYFLTHGGEQYYLNSATADYGTYGDDPRTLRDNTQIIRTVGGDSVSKPVGWQNSGSYWWGQPAVGYFLADDPWVTRHNLQMLSEAGVDVVILDVTNGPQYVNAFQNLGNVAEQMIQQGLKTPKFAFITYSSSGVVANELYDRIYSVGQFKDLWFYWQGKPLMLGYPQGSNPTATPARPEVASFFNWRYSWANTSGPNGNYLDEWQWIDARSPQTAGWHVASNIPEEMSVALGGWSTSNLGRSFQGGVNQGGVEPALDQYDLAANVNLGLFFTQQWQTALTTNPQFVYVTGWNEWVASRQYAPGVSMLGHVTQAGQYYFVDNFNEEFSRDAMPMNGGYGDNYYMQLAQNIRKYKGVRAVPAASAPATIVLNNDFTQWNGIFPVYRDAPGDTQHRDWDGWGFSHYVDQSGRNDIVSCKVASDSSKIYFYVQASTPITASTGLNWMQLLIDSDQNAGTGWNGYDYTVNSPVIDASNTTLKRMSDGATSTISYQVSGNQLMLAIPRSLLSLTDTSRTKFDFHWVDNAAAGAGADITQWWYAGDSAPDGRYNYRYDTVVTPPVAGRLYQIINRNSGLVLDNFRGGLRAGTLVVQNPSTAGRNTQQWLLTLDANGYYVLTNVRSGLVLDDFKSNLLAGARVDVWTPDGSGRQEWQLVTASSGYVTLKNRHSGLMLSDYQNNVSSGAPVTQDAASGTNNQLWQFTPAN